jgi:hypothetical protein
MPYDPWMAYLAALWRVVGRPLKILLFVLTIVAVPLSWFRLVSHNVQTGALTIAVLLLLSAAWELYSLTRNAVSRDDVIAKGLNELEMLERLRSRIHYISSRNYGLDNLM